MHTDVLIETLHALQITVNGEKTISVLDLKKDLNFEIKRIYWINNKTEHQDRSAHAHKTLDQVIFCLSGSVEIELAGTHSNFKTVLSSNGEGIFVPHMHWKRITYLEPSILLCLASDSYDANDYIRDYADFESLLIK